ncbi:tetratricopeptide repeat protein [Thermodesulfobacteriota bacterium]
MYVFENPHVKTGLTSRNIKWAFTVFHLGNWYPFTLLSHMLDCQLYGLNPKGHHFNNLLIHILNTLLLFHILKRSTGSVWRSAIISALFALHPLHVEPVAWISSRKDVLSTFFWMLTMWAYIHYVERPGINRYLLVLLFLSMGLMSKAMLVTLPFILLLFDYWPLNRLNFKRYNGKDSSVTSNSPNKYLKRSSTVQLLLEKFPFFLVSIFSIILTLIGQRYLEVTPSFEPWSLKIRIANALTSYVSYILKMVWPLELSVFYPHPGMPPWWKIVGAFFFLGFVSFLVVKAARRHPYLPVGWFWYIGTLLPVIGFVQIGLHAIADRYTYVPLVGLFIILAWGFHDLFRNWRYRKIVLTLIAGFGLLYCVIFTNAQIARWNNGVSLFEHALAITSKNYAAHYNLGIIHIRLGNLKEASHHSLEALRIDPESGDANFNLGYIFSQQDNLKKALYHYDKALSIDPDNEKAHNDLGVVYVRMKKPSDAIFHFSEALRIRPGFIEARNNLTSCIQEKGDNRD